MLYQTKTFSKYGVTVILINAKMKIFNQMVALIFQPIFVFYIEKTKKVLPLCNYIDCSEGTLQCAVVQGMVKCSSFFFFAVIDSFNQHKSYFFLRHKSVICQCLDMREKMILVFRIYNENVYDSYSYLHILGLF